MGTRERGAYGTLLSMLGASATRTAAAEAHADFRAERSRHRHSAPSIGRSESHNRTDRDRATERKNYENHENATDAGPLLQLLGKRKRAKHRTSHRTSNGEEEGDHVDEEDIDDDQMPANGVYTPSNSCVDRFREHDARLLSPTELESLRSSNRNSANAVELCECECACSYGASHATKWTHLPSELRNTDDNDDDTLADSLRGKSSQPVVQPTALRKRKPIADSVDEEPRGRAQMRAALGSYKDIMLDCRGGGFLDPEINGQHDHILDAYLIHALSHTLRSRRALKDQSQGEQRTQGFTRARVLLLMPMRNVACKAVERLVQLMGGEETVKAEGLQRFRSEFGDDDEDSEWRSRMRKKPADHRDMFSGSTDDHFKVGIAVGRSRLKLFADFYSSDIIVASPIGLATRIQDTNRSDRCDFLSSIELCVMDNANVMLMQNWSHVETVLQSLNLQPAEQHGTDFTRVKTRFLEEYSHHHRQTVLLSDFCFAELNAAFAAHSCSFEGALVTRRTFSMKESAVAHVRSNATQQLERFHVSSSESEPDDRFEYFKEHIWPRVSDSSRSGVLIFCSSYLEFCRLRAFLRERSSLWCANSEYANGSDVARARSYFADGRFALMLYSERAHYFRRHRIHGIKTLLFYSLPHNANFYSELVSLVADGLQQQHWQQQKEAPGSASVHAIFSQLDALKLERIVGTKRATRMLSPRTAGTFLMSPVGL